MKRVLISFPTSSAHPFLHKHVVFASWRLLADKRYEITPIIPSHNPFENNLHHILNQFLDEGYDYWLSIDYDNPPINNPLDLIRFSKDIMGVPTPILHVDKSKPHDRPMYLGALKKQGEEYSPIGDIVGLQEVDAITFGCFLLSKRVFDNPKMREAPFQRTFNKDGTVNKGSDIAFCERAKAQGFKMYVHGDYLCRHFNLVELAEINTAYHRYFLKQ